MEFSKQFIEIMDALADKVGIVVDWGAKNVVPYVQDLGGRLVDYEISTSIAWITIGVVISIIMGIITKLIVRRDFDDELKVVVWIIFGLTCLTTVVMICCQTFDIIEALTIPEKTIYDMMQYYVR